MAGTDPQLSTILMTLLQEIIKADQGSIIDIGCGNGSLLERLCAESQFIDSDWIYVAVDDDDKLDEVQRLARRLGVSRRVEPKNLKEFYSTWPDSTGAQLAFCRNVFHELSISMTAQLLEHVSIHLRKDEVFIVQDLMNFTEGERNNACWFPPEFTDTVEKFGWINNGAISFSSKSGARWFNLVATRNEESPPVDGGSLVTEARKRQWDSWFELDTLAKAGNQEGEIAEALDLDLQITALTRQLREVGLFADLNETLEKRIKSRFITSAIDSFIKKDQLAQNLPTNTIHFRERGEQLTVLEEFLRGGQRVAVVMGGRGTGKTMLVTHLLSHRSYSKSVVFINGRDQIDLWSFIESFFSQLGLRLSVEALAGLKQIGWRGLDVPWRQFLNKFSGRFTLVIDNWHHMVDSNGAISDHGLSEAIKLLVAHKDSKVILTQSRTELQGIVASDWKILNPPIVHLGRYASHETVVNVLDDRIDRSKLGVAEYPKRLLDVIDKHPLAAKLAADIIHLQGVKVFDDQAFFEHLEARMFDDLWRCLVDDSCIDAINVASMMRIATPMKMLEGLSSKASVRSGIDNSALYASRDYRWGHLVAALAIFRKKKELSKDDETPEKHQHIADAYRHTYKEDDDPKWIRESYYHRLLGADASIRPDLNRYYLRELVNSAEYLYKNRAYGKALELFEAGYELGDLREESLIKRASCLVRTGLRAKGEDEYKRLIDCYPWNKGAKLSFVFAMCWISDFTAAKLLLEKFALDKGDPWVLGAWGRVWLGLHQYKNAEQSFRNILAINPKADEGIFSSLVRALQQQGAIKEAAEVIKQGLTRYPNDLGLVALHGACLERLRMRKEAAEILEPLFGAHPDRAGAALTLIKIYGHSAETKYKARHIFERAKRNATNLDDPIFITMEAEVLKIEERYDAAISVLNSSIKKDVHTLGMLFECSYHHALSMPSKDRILFASSTLATPIPNEFKENAPLMVNQARLALLAGDRNLFHQLLDKMSTGRVEPFEIESLLRLAQNPPQ